MGTYNDVELNDVELTGSRLLLRRWRADDAARVLEVVADRSMYDFLALPDPYDENVALDFVTRIGHEGRTEGTGLDCAVVEASSGRVVGAAGLRFAAADPDIGYWVAPDARGHGYAAEACRLLADFGFGTLGLPRIAIHADVRNLASARTALAAGFAYEGTLRDGAPAAARGRGDLAYFGRVADDSGDPIAPAFPALPGEGLRDGMITLRAAQPDDAGESLEVHDEVSQAIGFGGPAMTLREAARRTARAGLDALVGGHVLMAIVDDETGALAGEITLRNAGPPGVGLIGYGVHPLFRGRGYTARALRLLAPWTFANGFARLELGAKVGNVASQRAALSGGFEPDGTRIGRLRNPDGTYTDEARFALLAPHPDPHTDPPGEPEPDAIAALE